MKTPFFKLLGISPGHIRVQYSDGVKVVYKLAPRLELYDEICKLLNEPLYTGVYYCANIEYGFVGAMQRNKYIGTGAMPWDCRVMP